MQLSCAFPPSADVVEHAKLAESLGYRRIWLYDSPALYTDVWVALARVAEQTRSIGLGPAVLVPNLRHVLVTAAAVATLEELAPGRLALAIGTGFTGRMMMGHRPLPWSRVSRYIRDLRALLRGERVEVEGKQIQLGQPKGSAPARPLETPILVAANGPVGVRVAGEFGDGIMCVGSPQPGFDWCALLAFGTVLDPGENWDSPRVFDAVGPGVAVIYHGSYEASREAVDALPGGCGWRTEIEAIPEAVRHIAIHEDHLVNVTERDRRHISMEMAKATFSGTPEELRAKLAAHRSAGLSELLYAPMGPDIPRELHNMASALAESVD